MLQAICTSEHTPVQHGGGVKLARCPVVANCCSVLRVRADCVGRLFTTKFRIVLHDLTHQMLDHLLADEPILLACQFGDCLCDRFNDFIRFSGIDFIPARRRSLRLARKSRRR